jgi:hypothetical protein
MFTDRKKFITAALAAFLLFAGFIFPQYSFAQKKAADTSYMEHSPKKATYWSLLPGAGQIYNKKYWKLPIVYTGFGVIGYFAFSNRSEYLKFHDAYICSVTLGEACDNELADKYSTDDLKSIRDYYRRNMELSFILGAAWYVLQMLDAVVDAHLYYWDVSEDISLKVEPVINPVVVPQAALPANDPLMNGVKITVKF